MRPRQRISKMFTPSANYCSMKRALYDYDIFPKVFLTGRRKITIRPLGARPEFSFGDLCVISVLEVEKAQESRYPGTNGGQTIECSPDEKGTLVFEANFPNEEMYLIRIAKKENGEVGGCFLELRVYALAEDMKGRYPFRGDLHMHTCRSDGHETPAVVAANYRGHGYDFTVISDHHRYYPSLEARDALRIEDNNGNETSALTDFLVVPGEEVHLPFNPVHYVNFGGRFSINALITPTREASEDKFRRSIDGNDPETLTSEQFAETIRKEAESVPRQIESERMSFAVAKWIYEQQKKAGGIGIYPHPYWLCCTMQLSEDFARYIYGEHPFDAFEVLGGESYYQHNGFQTAFYYEEKAKGIDYPVVGSTDSHGSTEHNRNALIASTIVFAEANTTSALCDSIRKKYSVAVDSISPEYRLVGDFRFVKFGSFLLEEWYPLHDLACKAEGYYLKEFVNGDPEAEKVLLAMKGQLPRMFRKYFEM